MAVQDLSAMLWRERELLELLIFKLEEEQLLLAAGKSRWIQHATREVEQVMDRLRTTGLARAVEVAAVAAEWGTDEGTTLRELAAHAPTEAWAEIFADHFQAMSESTRQIKALRDANEQFLRSAIRASQEMLAGAEVKAGTYDASGSLGQSTPAAHLFDTRA